jgi:uncharacterized membrane protein YhhN
MNTEIDPMIVAFVATAVVAIANWYSRWTDRDRLEMVSKPATTIGAIVVSLLAGGPHSATIVVVIALALCLAGDIALLKTVDQFVVGLGAFLLGHVAFMVAFAMRGFDRWPVIGVAVVGCAVLLGTVAMPIVRGASAKGFGLPVRGYLVVITAMCLLGWATGNWLVMVGATAFIISDSILGWEVFVEERRWMSLAIMVTYHVAIVSLALSLTI